MRTGPRDPWSLAAGLEHGDLEMIKHNIPREGQDRDPGINRFLRFLISNSIIHFVLYFLVSKAFFFFLT